MRLVLAGFGVVGQSFAQLLSRRQAELTTKYGLVPRVVAVVDRSGSVTDERGVNLAKVISSKRANGTVGGSKEKRTTSQIIGDIEADVLVESTPTDFRNGEPGLGHIRAAFLSKKHVVTCNKGPLGIAFQALHELARHNGVEFRYSGAVGGGTPILDFGKTCARGDDIVRVSGILNGTCNFILTKMEREGLNFSDALAQAQREGYAEANPSLDVDGYDTAVKLAIIANHLMLSRSTAKEVKVRGIRDVTVEQVARATKEGKALRLVATAESGLSVEPTLIARDDPLCISGPLNAVKFHCKDSGPKVIVGKGAGGPETASSLLRDLIEIRSLMNDVSTS